MTGQFPVKWTLKWRFECRFPGKGSWGQYLSGSEGGRTGKREKLGFDAVIAEVSVTPGGLQSRHGPTGGPTRDHPLLCTFQPPDVGYLQKIGSP